MNREIAKNKWLKKGEQKLPERRAEIKRELDEIGKKYLEIKNAKVKWKSLLDILMNNVDTIEKEKEYWTNDSIFIIKINSINKLMILLKQRWLKINDSWGRF